MAAIGEHMLFFHYGWNLDGAITNFIIDATDEAVAYVFTGPPSLTVISKCYFAVGAVTGTSPTYLVSLEGVDSSGNPDGVALVSETYQPTSSGIKEITFDPTYTMASRGQLMAITVRYSSGTIDGSNRATFGTTQSNVANTNVPYVLTYSSSAWTKSVAAMAPWAVSDGTNFWGGPVHTHINSSVTINTTTSVGNRFSVPAGMGATMNCVGAWVGAVVGAAKTLTVTLYDMSDNVLAARSIDSDASASTTNSKVRFIHWDDAAVTLTCGTEYRIVASADDTGSIAALSASTDTKLASFVFGTSVYYTSGSTGSWTDTTTRRALIGPLIDDITEPSGGYTGYHRHIGLIGTG